ncbi:17058_t:CDS:2, partial [Racocetra fulgida]
AYVKLKPKEFNRVLELFRSILSSALKSNIYLEKAVLTGILRIAKVSLFSGLNNVAEYSLLDERFTEYYGFTQEEVNELLTKLPLIIDKNKVKEWYNGYEFGGQTVYNPLSVMRCLNEKGKLDNYWIDSGDTELIEQTLISNEIQEGLQNLLAGKKIEKKLHKQISLKQIKTKKDIFYSLLVFAGYLNPNLTDQPVAQKLNIDATEYYILMKPLLEKEFEKIKEFEKRLREFLLRSGSYHDQSGEEKYHSLMNGLLSYLGLECMVISNCESGDGRYDHALIPRIEKSRDIAFIFEYKKAANKEDKELDLAAEKGLKQIDEFNYDIRIKEHSQVKRIIKIGLAFRGKKLKARYKIEEKTSDDF